MRLLLVALALTMTMGAAIPGQADPSLPVCEGDCTVTGHGAGYIPPIIAITSGTQIVWESLDATHPSQDGNPPFSNPEPCFTATAGASYDSVSVRFAAEGGVVTATVGLETKVCEDARPGPTGGFVLDYFCALHPNMRGRILIDA